MHICGFKNRLSLHFVRNFVQGLSSSIRSTNVVKICMGEVVSEVDNSQNYSPCITYSPSIVV